MSRIPYENMQRLGSSGGPLAYHPALEPRRVRRRWLCDNLAACAASRALTLTERVQGFE